MAEIIKTTNTITGMMNEYHSRFGLPYVPLLAHTLNVHYSVGADQLPSVIPGTSQYKPPVIKYFGIGTRGCYNVDEDITDVYDPRGNEDHLYRPIPFRIRPLDEDLTATERTQYRMRHITSINGIPYVAYYLKVLTIPSNSVEVTYINADEQELEYNMVPNLSPTPIKLSELPDDVTKVIVKVQAICQITAEEVAEAVSVLYGGNAQMGRISEIGVFTGEDRNLPGVTAGGGTMNYMEAIYTQLSMKRCSQGNSDFSTIAPKITFGNGNLLLIM